MFAHTFRQVYSNRSVVHEISWHKFPNLQYTATGYENMMKFIITDSSHLIVNERGIHDEGNDHHQT